MTHGEQLTLPGGQQVPGHVVRTVANTHWRGGRVWRAKCSCGWSGSDEGTRARADQRAAGHLTLMIDIEARRGGDG